MASCWALFTNIPFWDGDIVDPLNSKSLVENWDENTINSGKHDIFNRKLIFQPLLFGHYIQILKGFHIKQHYLGDYPEGGDPSVAEVVTSTWISSPAARFPGRFWQAVPAPMFQHVSTIFNLQMLGENTQQPNAIFRLPWRLSRCRYVQRLCLSDRVPWLEPPWHLSRGHERCVSHQGSQGGWWWGCPSQSTSEKYKELELWTISCDEFVFAGFWSKTTAQNHQLNDCQWLATCHFAPRRPSWPSEMTVMMRSAPTYFREPWVLFHPGRMNHEAQEDLNLYATGEAWRTWGTWRIFLTVWHGPQSFTTFTWMTWMAWEKVRLMHPRCGLF